MSTLGPPESFKWHRKDQSRLIQIIAPEDSNSRVLELRVVSVSDGLEVEIFRHRFKEREHQDYIAFYAYLAAAFGTVRPAEYLLKGPELRDSAVIPLLTTNLTSQILFGYGDPAVLRVEDTESGAECYYVAATSNDAPDAFPLIRSRDLLTWNAVGFIFPAGHTPPWALVGEGVADYWAPEIHKVANEFRAYFVARDRETRELCIGVAKAARPDGPFVAEASPILRRDRIDPHLLYESEHQQYLYWKEDANGLWPQMLAEFFGAAPQTIDILYDSSDQRQTASFIAGLSYWTATLSPMERFFALQPLLQISTTDFGNFRERLGGISRGDASEEVRSWASKILQTLTTHVYAQLLDLAGTGLVGSPFKVLENDQKWEAHVIEGMWVLKRGAKYYMFYSANDFSTPEYGIGVAVADSPIGPFEKSSAPLLGSSHQWIGPGHPSVTIGPGGETLLFFHAYVPMQTGYKKFRALLCAALDFSGRFPTLRTDLNVL